MPLHPDFVKMLNKFKQQYGEKEGERVYYAWVYNENLDDTKSLESQKGYKADKIEGNRNKVLKSIESLIEADKKKYSLIIDKWMETFYNEGIQSAATELSMEISEFGNTNLMKQQLKALQDNTKTIAFSLMDDINKEVGLLVTNIELNNIPIKNTELKKEIQKIFETKQARLESQITTETTRATNTGLIFGYKSSGLVTHKQWVAVIDDRTSAGCQALNGEIVEIGKPFSLGVYSPPLHPNCRSRVIPVTLS